jgi:polyisoprenoid-binding protein YceI
MYRYVLSAALFLLSPTTFADWTLDNAGSTLSFISIKKGNIAEVHTFDALVGTIAADGTVTVKIALDSVDTQIPIRDERMRELLFETSSFSAATFKGQIDPAILGQLEPGEPLSTAVEATLDLHGKSQPLTLQVVAVRVSPDLLMVGSRLPVIVQAGEFDLLAGIEKLREIAGLPSISSAVPVSFVLSFNQ